MKAPSSVIKDARYRGPRLVSPAHLRGSNNFFRREKKKVGRRIDERQVLPVMHINFMKVSLLRIIQAHE